MIPAGHVRSPLRNRLRGGDGSPQGGTRRINSVETTTGAPEQEQRVRFSHSKKFSAEANAELETMMASLATSMKDAKGIVDNFGENVKTCITNQS